MYNAEMFCVHWKSNFSLFASIIFIRQTDSFESNLLCLFFNFFEASNNLQFSFANVIYLKFIDFISDSSKSIAESFLLL